jgi:hypothetical protein
MINYKHIIPQFVGPKLAYHGFKCDEEHWYPPHGHFFFRRNYWCSTQRISICPLEYDTEEAKAVISRSEDFPTEVPTDLLLNRDPGTRLWLSNKYLTAVLQSESRVKYLTPDSNIAGNEPTPSTPQRDPVPNLWWQFHGEHGLQRTLSAIVLLIECEGLDWFEEQVVDIRRHHEKLERRRLKAKRTALEQTDP